mmetsp:Transcript_50406/g.99229  ORF Transcript_50406/g.99229 Transcript_50406/m.99229 type:complete len:89 (+) Transcript_50406:1284-1550(+)
MKMKSAHTGTCKEKKLRGKKQRSPAAQHPTRQSINQSVHPPSLSLLIVCDHRLALMSSELSWSDVMPLQARTAERGYLKFLFHPPVRF